MHMCTRLNQVLKHQVHQLIMQRMRILGDQALFPASQGLPAAARTREQQHSNRIHSVGTRATMKVQLMLARIVAVVIELMLSLASLIRGCIM